MPTSYTYEAYEARMAAAAALEADILPLNKAALFDTLQAAGINRVVVRFDGYGDSGQIEAVEAFDAADVAGNIPDVAIEFREVTFDGPSVAARSVPVEEAIEMMAFALLEQTHAGWENNEGAFGDFTFDVTERSIAFDYNKRHIESTSYYHEF